MVYSKLKSGVSWVELYLSKLLVFLATRERLGEILLMGPVSMTPAEVVSSAIKGSTLELA